MKNEQKNKEAKKQGKTLKAIRKNINKNKEKEGIHVELMHFIQRRAYLRSFMHAIIIVACVKVHTSKMVKKYLRLYFCPFSDLFHPFLKKIDLLHSCARI